MDLRILIWNVEHFGGRGKGARVGRVADVAALIKDENPDIFALIEVEGREVFQAFTAAFPGYSFTITEGAQVQEIMIGVRGGISAFVTQRNEFKRSNPALRPAALLTVNEPGGDNLSMLFTHLKSLPSPEGFGLRDAMLEKVRGLKGAIDKAVDGKSKFILLGDLNTMGMDMTFSDKDMTGAEEIRRVDRILAYRGLYRMPKSHAATFNNGSGSRYPQADLDHVYATDNLSFKDQASGAKIRVAGWAEADGVQAADAWIARFSDHAPLVFEIEGV
ncbi:MAG: endonuclease/exonuclease/phosphatase family protein [Rhodobacteraceae bacterium]|nr:endonuclease/exonuclease/phosphatase family protein [Paracoccaceae bacterium]